MGKSKRYDRRNEETEEERQERILAQIAATGRLPVVPPRHFHDTGERQTRRKDRKNERARLRQLKEEKNNG